MGIVSCGGCGLKFNRSNEEAEFIKGKWYHKICAETKHEKMQLDEYICKLFHLKALGPTNNVLIKKYKEEFGYTYIGMYNALKYFYEIKRHSTKNSEERVGIIPYVYNDAQEYYQYLEDKKDKITNHAIEEKAQEIKVNPIQQKAKKQKNNKDELDLLFNEE